MYFYIHNFYEPYQVNFVFIVLFYGGGFESLFSTLPYVKNHIKITHM